MRTDGIGHPDHDTLAAYSIGGLGTAETSTCEPHVRTCDSCQAFVAEFEGVRDMLSLVPASLVLDDPALTSDLPKPEPRPATSSKPRHVPWYERFWLPAAAVAVAIVVCAVLVPRILGGDTSPPRPRAVASSPTSALTLTGLGGDTRIGATMWLAPGTTSSRFSLRLTDVPDGTALRVVADLTDGSSLQAGMWRVPEGDAKDTLELDGSVSASAGRLTDFRVVNSSGQTLVKLAMPRH